MLTITPNKTGQMQLASVINNGTPQVASGLFGSTNRSQWFQWYARANERLHQIDREFADFLKVVIQANLGPSAVQFAPTIFNHDGLAEVAVRPLPDIAAALKLNLQRTGELLVERFTGILDELVVAKHIGSIQYFDRDVCRFSYYTASHTVRILGVETHNGSRIVQKQLTHSHFEHVHDVIDAKESRLPANGIKRPTRVDHVIKHTPSWLSDSLAIVVGQEIAHAVKEVNRETETVLEVTPSFNRDPALVFGPYVLCGWGEDETAATGQKRS